MRDKRNLIFAGDLLLLITALITSNYYVSGSFLILSLFSIPNLSLATAYAILIIIISATLSAIRSFFNREIFFTKKEIAFKILIVVVSIFIFAGLFNEKYKATEVKDVVAPYFSYLISVIFCFGAGYASADLIIFTINRMWRSK